MDRSHVENEIREYAAEVAEIRGYELVHVEFTGVGNKSAVRVFIDKEGGITHDDCSAISQDLEKALEASDPIRGSYILEVSSPGIERGLYKESDYERFAGEPAKIKTHAPLAGQRNFRGIIKGLEARDVLFDDRTSGAVRIPFDLISKANLEFDVERELREAKKRRS